MPNWCHNRLTVISRNDAGRKQLTEFMDNAKEDESALSLEHFVPTPPELLSGPSGDLLDWRRAHWGTKCDVQANLIDSDPEFLEFEFNSAWTPPTAWIENASKCYPDLEFRLKYDEDLCAFMGFALAVNGKLKELTLDYSSLWHEEVE